MYSIHVYKHYLFFSYKRIYDGVLFFPNVSYVYGPNWPTSAASLVSSLPIIATKARITTTIKVKTYNYDRPTGIKSVESLGRRPFFAAFKERSQVK